jgi:hypothetical protein
VASRTGRGESIIYKPSLEKFINVNPAIVKVRNNPGKTKSHHPEKRN